MLMLHSCHNIKAFASPKQYDHLTHHDPNKLYMFSRTKNEGNELTSTWCSAMKMFGSFKIRS